MYSALFETTLSFILSALVVIIITFIAERYGTKTGGILGTLPSTIIIAFVFIALNKGLSFAAQAVAIVPAEMGVNLIFLLMFILLAHRSTTLAIIGSLGIWSLITVLFYFANISNVIVSLVLYIVFLITTFYILERVKKIPSTESVRVHYTPLKILSRGLLAGIVIACAVFFSNFGTLLSGIFSVFPAIFLSTMIITTKDHGPEFAAGMAKSMILGSTSVVSYAAAIHYLYPISGLIWGTIFAFLLSLIPLFIILTLRKKIL